MRTEFKILGLVVLVLDTIYLAWLVSNVVGLGYVLLFAELLIASLPYLLVINHWTQDHVLHHETDPEGSVDVFIPTVNEPLEMLENTVEAATKIDYDNKKLYLLMTVLVLK